MKGNADKGSSSSRRAAIGLAAMGIAMAATESSAKDSNKSRKKGAEEGGPSELDTGSFDDLRSKNAEVPQLETPTTIEDVPTNIFDRTDEEQQLFEKVTNRLRNDLGFSSQPDGAITFSADEMEIVRGFAFHTQPADVDFLYLHIEPLLDQAADLLDRCLKERAVWDDHASRMFKLLLELNEYTDLDSIHRIEEREGIYDVPHERSYAEANAEFFNNNMHKWLKDFVDSTLGTYWTNSKINEVGGAAQLSAWLSGVLPYTFDDQSFAGYVNHTWNSVSKRVSDHAKDSATEQAFHSLFTQWRSVLQQKWQFFAFEEIANRRLPGLRSQYEWDVKNSSFQKWEVLSNVVFLESRIRRRFPLG